MPKYPNRQREAWWYGADWQPLRRHKLATNPLCEICEKQGRVTAATVVDHIIPIRDDPSKRLEWNNLRSLCKPHHDSSAQAKDTLGYMPDVGVDGTPVDARHPFYVGVRG